MTLKDGPTKDDFQPLVDEQLARWYNGLRDRWVECVSEKSAAEIDTEFDDAQDPTNLDDVQHARDLTRLLRENLDGFEHMLKTIEQQRRHLTAYKTRQAAALERAAAHPRTNAENQSWQDVTKHLGLDRSRQPPQHTPEEIRALEARAEANQVPPQTDLVDQVVRVPTRIPDLDPEGGESLEGAKERLKQAQALADIYARQDDSRSPQAIEDEDTLTALHNAVTPKEALKKEMGFRTPNSPQLPRIDATGLPADEAAQLIKEVYLGAGLDVTQVKVTTTTVLITYTAKDGAEHVLRTPTPPGLLALAEKPPTP